MQRFKHVLIGAIVILALLSIVIVGEPFSRRYDWSTARQWLAFYGQTRRLPERAVVAHFGPEAIPLLIRESRPSGLFSFTLAVEPIIGRRLFLQSIREDDFDRRLACHDWALLLLSLYPDAYEQALVRTQTIEQGLELTRLFYGDRYLGPTLKRYSRQSTNQLLQARAGELLDAYRAVN